MAATDKELLELAAKAAGMEGWRYSGPSGLHKMLDPSRPKATGSVGAPWNPLADDGDALRLARDVGLRVDFNYQTGQDKRRGIAVWTPGDHEPYPPFWTIYGNRPDAEARCAIVRAAAEIGRATTTQASEKP